jgi:hypothetical protein
MFIEEFEKKERMGNLLKSLGIEINSNKEGAGVHGS